MAHEYRYEDHEDYLETEDGRHMLQLVENLTYRTLNGKGAVSAEDVAAAGGGLDLYCVMACIDRCVEAGHFLEVLGAGSRRLFTYNSPDCAEALERRDEVAAFLKTTGITSKDVFVPAVEYPGHGFDTARQWANRLRNGVRLKRLLDWNGRLYFTSDVLNADLSRPLPFYQLDILLFEAVEANKSK